MIEQKSIFANIPSGKFHSALMTSYSINLYYWDIQLMQTLSRKGINFVSALVDSDCLSEQLLKFSKAFTTRKPLEFSLHGYKSKGAFHPKIQFYAGNDSILVLVGSGNLTICGHGGNMEVWTPVMVDSKDNPAFPFVRDVWSYLKSLYLNLGEEAENITKSIEENCDLLLTDYQKNADEYYIDADNSIRLFTNGNTNIFLQCVNWIGGDNIEEITVLSPFYDSHAELVQALYSQYQPLKMNVIVEDGFGEVPRAKYIPDYVNLFKWSQIRPDGKYQKFYHAKCVFFKGKNFNYVLCGSSNASVAAFGLPGVLACNQEASVGYKSKIVDYFKETGFILTDPISKTELDTTKVDILPSNNNTEVWIKEASYDDGSFILNINSPDEFKDARAVFYSGDRLSSSMHVVSIVQGDNKISGLFRQVFNPLYVEILDSAGKVISNRQFVIPTYSMILNNPSAESVNYRRRCLEIESGQFVSGSVLKFIEQVLSDTEGSLKPTSKVTQGSPSISRQSFDFNSLEDYLHDDGTGITGDFHTRMKGTTMMRSTLLFDSMVSYITRSSKEKEEENFDDEETENVKKSVGKENRTQVAVTTFTPKSVEDVIKRVNKMFDTYLSYLLDNSAPEHNAKPINFMHEIKRYMAAIFFIHRLLSFRYFRDDMPGEDLPLLRLCFSRIHRNTTTEYLYRIINAFSAFIFRNNVIQEYNHLMTDKVDGYKKSAFELTFAVLAVCDWLNEGVEDYQCILEWHKEQTLKNISKSLDYDISSVPDVHKQLDRAIQELPSFDMTTIQRITELNMSILRQKSDSCVWTELFGYVKLSPNANGKTATPCTMLGDWNKNNIWFTPNYAYMYSDGRVLKVKPRM